MNMIHWLQQTGHYFFGVSINLGIRYFAIRIFFKVFISSEKNYDNDNNDGDNNDTENNLIYMYL